MIRADLQNCPPSANDVLHRLLTNRTSVGFAYAKDNPTEEDFPKSKLSTFSEGKFISVEITFIS